MTSLRLFQMKRSIAHIGTYTRLMPHVHGKGEGIYTVELCHQTGAMKRLGTPTDATNSSYLCQNSAGDRLYAISEICDFQNKEDGCLNVFAINDERLSHIQQCRSLGMGPAYIRIDNTGTWLFNANYVQGNIVVYPISEDGKLGEATDNIQFHGNGPNSDRQEAPHPHAILPSPDNRFVYAIDLGTDRIRGYHFDGVKGRLLADERLDLNVGPGTGPRHFIFHPKGDYAYFVKELTSELSVCRFDSDSGELAIIQTVSTLPIDFSGESHCSEIRITRDGCHIYVANRGHDSIAVFEISSNGSVQPQSHTDCQGHIPRNICLSPDDQFLLIANQESNQLVSLHRKKTTGELQNTGQTLDIPTPAFIEFSKGTC